MDFDSLLVANRGEIACRIMCTARDLGLRTVAVYSEADRDAPHVALADDAMLIGPPAVAESYLNIEAILKAARKTGVGAVHPGYGFLSENEVFAEAVEDAGLVFIGPPAKAIYLMGNKAEAKRLMIAANVPCVPGYQGTVQEDATLTTAADEIGYPVMVKAAAGGGGRGMRLVAEAAGMQAALAEARSEAANAFGSGELIIEKAIVRPRHVEIQIFADRHGNCIHLGERDCSVQRRHQKVIEEAPCPVMTPDLREQMGSAAVAAAKKVDYCGAGTVEFLLDETGSFYFLEMNTRLQVEHPVTEMVTGLDLVAMQIAVAQGASLPLSQSDVRLDGHAIEARLYAEDPANEFLPATGRIGLWRPATGDGVRVDAGIATGQEVTPFYDPMLAKIIAWGETRETARSRLVRALEDTVLLGPVTNSGFLADIVRDKGFARGEATTAFLDEAFPNGVAAQEPGPEDFVLAAAIMLDADRTSAFANAGYVSSGQLGWSSAELPATPLRLSCVGLSIDLQARNSGDLWVFQVGDDRWEIELERHADLSIRATVNGRRVAGIASFSPTGSLGLAVGARRLSFHRVRSGAEDEAGAAGGRVAAPMPGVVIDILVTEGQSVEKGEALAVLEAMKMQHRIAAPVAGVVEEISAASGDQLGSGDLMMEIAEAAE